MAYEPKKLTIFDVQAKVAAGEKVFQVTATDFPTALLVDRAGIDFILIGELYRPTVGLLGCTLPRELSHLIPGPATFLTGEMDADEAARTAEMLGLELAVACHYLAKDAEVDRFLELVPKYDTSGRREAVAPEVGQTLVVDRSGWTLEEAQA